MFDLLGPLRKLATVLAFIAFFTVANAALLLALSSCMTATSCIGSAHLPAVLTAIKNWGGMILPHNFYVCVQFMFLAMMMRRAYDFAVKLMTVVASSS